MPDMQHLLEEYIAQASVHSSTELSSKASVRVANDAADRLRSIALEIGTLGPESVAMFGELLNSSSPRLRTWVAHHLLELMRPGPRLTSTALAAIEQAAASDGPDAAGERLWLKNWQREHPPT